MISGGNVGKYSSTMEHLGKLLFSRKRVPVELFLVPFTIE
jgi:hypothetical protein